MPWRNESAPTPRPLPCELLTVAAGQEDPPSRPAVMQLRHVLQAGVDTSVIASAARSPIRSTDAYVHADITITEKALA